MPNDRQRVVDYLADILLASKGSFTVHKNNVYKNLSILDGYFFALNSQNVSSFKNKQNGLDSKYLNQELLLLVDETKALKDMPTAGKLKELRLFFSSTNHYFKTVSNLASLGSLSRPLFNIKLIFLWNEERTKAFEKMKEKIVNLIKNRQFDVKRNTRAKKGPITDSEPY